MFKTTTICAVSILFICSSLYAGQRVIRYINVNGTRVSVSPSVSSSSSGKQVVKASDSDIAAYFRALAFDRSAKKILKWGGQVKVYCAGTWDSGLKKELTALIADIEEITGDRPISIVKKQEDANFTIFVGSSSKYASMEPRAKKSASHNCSLMYINWLDSGEIMGGTMYINPRKARTLTYRRHILRKKFTQALGLVNNSMKYKDSVFNGKGGYLAVKYSVLDREVIRVLFDARVKFGMSYNDCSKVLYSIVRSSE
jgi:hypothetical protein